MIKAIIFDMDGTILNTLTDITIAVNYALSLKNLPTKTEDEIKMAVGNGAFRLIERVVPKAYTVEETRDLFHIYQSYYETHASDHTGPYPDIIELLKNLRSKGYKLAVVSNKFEHLVEELNQTMFQGLFHVSVGEVKGIPIKPAPDMVYKALDLLGIDQKEALFVGDSEVDMMTAFNAFVTSVGVTWGFRPESLLVEHNADYIIHQPFQLLSILEKENTL